MKSKIYRTASDVAFIIRSGLAMVIPVLFIGSITVLLNGFPARGYQVFLDTYLEGMLRSIIISIQYATVGILAVYITIALNISYMNREYTERKTMLRFGSLMGCLTGFFILVGFFSGDPDISLLSGQGVFSAMIAGISGSFLFRMFEKRFVTQKMVFADGADSEFNASLQVILPYLCVALCFAVANYLIMVLFNVTSVQHLFIKVVDTIFIKMHRSYSSGLLFTSLISVMWWFGIHGNNVLNQVARDLFTDIIPQEIISKSFLDTFVNMGGAGCMTGLLLALPIFGKRSSTKKLFKMAVVPGLFNIGEMLVLGFPVIYNPIMAVPFILAPVLCFTNAYLLTEIGFVPVVSKEVVWTTPVLLSGYLATGSVRGIITQLLNIVISLACYAPFVIINEKKSLEAFADGMNELIGIFKEKENSAEKISLTDYEGNAGRFAKHLAADLEASISSSKADENPLSVNYWFQNDYTGKCIGAESGLCWNHKVYGYVYPPLVLELARESGDLYALETYITEKSVSDSERFKNEYGEGFKMTVSITASTLCDKRFVYFLQEVADRYRLKNGNICINITDKTQLPKDHEIESLIANIKVFGYTFEQKEESSFMEEISNARPE